MIVSRALVFSLLLVLAGGCRSFDESIKPILRPTAPEGYVPPVYIKGTRSITAVNPNELTLEVWRLSVDIRKDSAYPDSIRLFARVFDREKNLVTDLAPPYYKGPGDYRTIWSGLREQLGEGGPEVPITDFTVREFSDRDGIPFELALVLDYSGSMTSSMAQIEEAARAFIRLKRPQDRITIVKFGREPKLVATASSSESELIAQLPIERQTDTKSDYGYYSSMYAATQLGSRTVAESPQGNPRAVIVFTDGEDNASAITAADVFEHNKSKEVPVFAVGFGAMNRDVLSDLTTYTGGRLYQTYTPEELRAAFEDIYRNLRNYYLVSYIPPRAPGRHLVTLSMNPPGATTSIAAKAEYSTLGDKVIGPDKPIVLPDILFEYNQAVLRPESMQSIEAVAAWMLEYPRLKIEVRGHTDAQGTPEYNQTLSEARAETVRAAIVARGIDAARLRSRGFGLTMPKAPNDTEEGRAINRRTEFVILAR
ncbi:MAG TPA: OmpA family protein [Candidatus Kapabacteria bacterium]|jgi:VWFA-related protein|nr:OmpA family protein [Candidatus Kapabacteria bacterium]